MRSATAPNPSCSSGNRFNDDACDFECNICFDLAQDPVITLCGYIIVLILRMSRLQRLVGEDKLFPLYGKGRSNKRFKEYIYQCIEEFCVAQEQHIALLKDAQERRFQQLECRIKECCAVADYRIKKFRAEAEQRIKECRAEADPYQLVSRRVSCVCRTAYQEASCGCRAVYHEFPRKVSRETVQASRSVVRRLSTHQGVSCRV
ncbi:hypothetical protein KIW84_UN0405 [Lathyrus oleraceus]|nr:hypothetical protein KIW84_UN0405 [Pisum sativum]